MIMRGLNQLGLELKDVSNSGFEGWHKVGRQIYARCTAHDGSKTKISSSKHCTFFRTYVRNDCSLHDFISVANEKTLL